MIGIILILISIMMYFVVGSILHGLMVRIVKDRMTDNTEWMIIFWPPALAFIIIFMISKLIGVMCMNISRRISK